MRHWPWDRHTHRGSGAAALLGPGLPQTPLLSPRPGGVPGSGLHFRLSAAPDPDLQLCPASLYSQVTDRKNRPMGDTLILPTINAGKEGECARGMAGVVVLSTGRSRGLPGTWVLGGTRCRWGGAGPGLLIASVRATSRCREGRRVAELSKRADRGLFMQN